MKSIKLLVVDLEFLEFHLSIIRNPKFNYIDAGLINLEKLIITNRRNIDIATGFRSSVLPKNLKEIKVYSEDMILSQELKCAVSICDEKSDPIGSEIMKFSWLTSETKKILLGCMADRFGPENGLAGHVYTMTIGFILG
jgi:hypothetical protein